MAIRGVVTRGYMVDDTLLSMLGEASAKPEQPIMNRGYYARMMAIERLVGRFARACEASNWQLISLGAGLDTLYFRLRDRGEQKDRLGIPFFPFAFHIVATLHTLTKWNARWQAYVPPAS